jgi:hypothetical protein
VTDPVDDLAVEFREFGDEVNKHLTTLQRDLRQHASWIAEVAPVVDDHTSALQEHTTVLADLRADVNQVLEEMPRQPKLPPINWLTLSASEAQEVWTELGEWVDAKLVGRHFASREQLPDCWPLHPGAVEQLTWLWRSWQHAMLSSAAANPAAEWHSRWHRDSLTNVAAEVIQEADTTRHERCGPGTHFGAALPGAEQAQPAHLRQPPPHLAPPGTSAAVGGHPSPGQQGPAWGGPGQPAAVSPPNWTSGPQPWDTPPTFAGDGSMPPVSVPRGPARADDLGVDPTSDLAERRYWWPHLETARAADVSRRRDAERLAEEAKASESAPD